MITDTILHKYLRHLRYIDQGAVVHIDAVELALRLALDELAASTPSTQSTNGQAERDRDALAAEVHDLRSQLTQLEADNAAMIRRNKELADALHIAQNGTGLAIKNPPFVDPAPSAISNQQSPINNSMWSDPATLTTLDDIAKDWWIGCAAGRHQWRTVPKPIQLQLVRHIFSFGPETDAMTMRDFDAIKPDWMPGANSHTKTLNLSWQQLNDWRVEL